MMDFINTFIALLNEMSPYLLLGFLIAGILHAFVPAQLYSRHLSGSDMKSVVKAAAFGIPLPLCSCGVIPTASSLRNEGASRGATVSFLIATPQTGVDSIAATYSLLGLPFAVIRPLVALATSMLGGFVTNKIDDKQGGETTHTSACGGDCCTPPKALPVGFGGKVVEALRYGYFTMMQDIGKWLVVGLLLAAVITMVIPDDFFISNINNPIVEMLLMLAVAVPMYTCATGSIPVAMALMMKGMCPGAALVLLMAGPATNIASIVVIGKVLGKRATAAYIGSIIAGALAAALVIDYLLPAEWFSVANKAEMCCNCGTTGVFNAICSVVLALLLAVALFMRYFHNDIKKDNEMRLFKITGMECNHCRMNVINNLKALEGVEEVEVNLEKGEAAVKGTASDEAIIAKVNSLGYTCRKG